MYLLSRYFPQGSGVRLKSAIIARSPLVLLILVLISLTPISATAELTAQITAKDEKGYGRIVFRFFKLPSYQVRISDGVLIISFEDAINLKTEQFMQPLEQYFTAGRIDPNGKSIRFALSKKIKLNTIEAGNRLYIDLLPDPWVGLFPSLPQNVIDEISAKTRMKDEEKRKLLRREAFNRSKNILKVRVGQYPTFSRLVFDWTEKVGVKVSRTKNILNIQFDKLIRTDITRLKVDPPKFITGAKTRLTDDGLAVDIMLGENTSIKAFREGLAYVVDVSGPLNEEEQKENSQKTAILPSAQKSGPGTPPKGELSELVELEAEPSTQVQTKKATRQMSPVKTLMVKKPEMKKPEMKNKGAGVSPEVKSPGTLVANKILEKNSGKVPPVVSQVVNKTSKAGGKSVTLKAQPPELEGQKIKSVAMPEKSAATPKEKIPAGKAAPPTGARKANKLKVEAELVSGNVQLNFPFSEEIPAAMFQRGNTLWVVFDTRQELDLSVLQNGRKKYGRIAGFIHCVWPNVYRQIRLAVFAVIAYASSVVDV
ncbi:MAG: hypothetical protein VST69_01985, partial [Nitrospirota bacterium]|nr:hypothetical protein [Nitrospirota bacterium]